jgi:microcin C transport system substrate-binding protein
MINKVLPIAGLMLAAMIAVPGLAQETAGPPAAEAPAIAAEPVPEVPAAPAAPAAPPAAVDQRVWHHALSYQDTVKYPPGFTQFDYVNADAPKTGKVRLGDMGGFDTFNPILPQGEPASGLGLIYETLLTPSYDEILTDYGLLAEAVSYPDDISSATFRMNPAAKWHDGQQVTAGDVIWTFNKLKELNPNYTQYYANVTGAEETAPGEVTFTFDQTGNLELPKILGQLLVLPQHWWEGTDASGKQRSIEAITIEPPLGSGPYKIARFDQGRSITYELAPEYWGVNHPTQVGHNNFQQLTYEYFLDLDVQFEAFKADTLDYWPENRALRWATAYEIPAVTEGRMIKETFPNDDRDRGVMVGWAPNLRKPFFQDQAVREALNLAYDFEELNRTLFYGQYERIDSYFYGADSLRWKGLPEGEELAILESIRDQVPESVFTTEYKNPVAGDPASLRTNLRSALTLLEGAGYELLQPTTDLSWLWFGIGAVVLAAIGFFAGGKRRVPAAAAGIVLAGLAFGAYSLWFKPPPITQATLVKADTREPLTFEMLLNGPTQEPNALAFQKNLQSLGINVTIRTVDSPQYIERIRAFDYDMIYSAWGQSLSPGNEQRFQWGSVSRDEEGSDNYLGIADPGIDALIDKIIFADDRATLEAATHALDRVLLAHHYIVPTYTILMSRIARWDRFSHPEPLPEFSVGFPTIWWWDEAKAAKTGGNNSGAGAAAVAPAAPAEGTAAPAEPAPATTGPAPAARGG